MNILAVIFSKDRALQLHGNLASLRQRCAESQSLPIVVIYKATTPEFARGYAELKKEFADLLQVEWLEENHFKQDLLRCLVQPVQGGLLSRVFGRKPRILHEYVLFMVDDNLFVRRFSLSEALQDLGEHPNALGFSLRLGKNTVYCYSNRCEQPLPAFTETTRGNLRYSWGGQVGDFGYPLEVSSSIYRTADVIKLLQNLPYSNPNRLEEGFSVSIRLFSSPRPELLCFQQSVAFCAPLNKVQTVLDNRSGSSEQYSSEALNRMFLKNLRIAIDKLHDFMPMSAHQEIELPLVERVAE
jgi:hypothetical protein